MLGLALHDPPRPWISKLELSIAADALSIDGIMCECPICSSRYLGKPTNARTPSSGSSSDRDAGVHSSLVQAVYWEQPVLHVRPSTPCVMRDCSSFMTLLLLHSKFAEASCAQPFLHQ